MHAVLLRRLSCCTHWQISNIYALISNVTHLLEGLQDGTEGCKVVPELGVHDELLHSLSVGRREERKLGLVAHMILQDLFVRQDS